MLKLDNYFDIKWLVFAVTFTAIVLILTHIPQEFMELIPSQLQGGESGLDKLYHVAAYGVITFLFIFSLKSLLSQLSSLLVFFALLAVGMADEVTQPLVNRQASLTDFVANAIGIVMVLLLSGVRKRLFQKAKTE